MMWYMPSMGSTSLYMTTGEVAEVLGFSPEHIRRKCDRGEIPGAYQLDDGRSHWRVPREWVVGIINAVKPVKRAAAPTTEGGTDDE